jgi:exopolysaccharide biosynthesis polyprenyl glycosylphosphotransferase
MKKKLRLIFPLIFPVVDILGISLCFILAYWLRFTSGFIPLYKGTAPFTPYLKTLPVILLTFLFTFHHIGIYRYKNPFFDIEELFLLIKGTIIAFFILMALSFLYRDFSYSRITAGIFFFLVLSIFSISRVILKKIAMRLKLYAKRLIIVGANNFGHLLKEKLVNNKRLGIEFLGFVKAETEEATSDKIIGKLENIEEIFKNKSPDEVLITLPSSRRKEIMQVINKAEEFKIKFSILPELHELMLEKVEADPIAKLPIITQKTFPLDSLLNRVIKRIEDLVIASLLVIFISPVMGIIAILIKLSSKGPVLFKQERVGLDNRMFYILKFRSMRVDAEKDIGPVYAVPNDPRRTKIGKFLRRYNLDELPQLINVIKGEMSLVGPRPEMVNFVEKYKDIIPRYMERQWTQRFYYFNRRTDKI